VQRSSSALTRKKQLALAKSHSMYSSAQTATNWTGTCAAQQQRPHTKEATGPWEVAQHVQQRPNSHKLDRNSPQGPPVLSLAIRSLASLVVQDPPVLGAVQQHASCKKGICCGLL